jgi:AcrR family transcriptional regulator
MPKSTNQKEAIIKAALKLFARNSYASTPVSLIAKTARVSQGLMYNYFRSKEDLLKEIIALGFQDIKTSMKAYGESDDPRKNISNHVRKTIEIVEQNKAMWKLLHTIRLQEKVVIAMQKQFRQIVESVALTFRKTFKKLGYPNPEMEAVLFLAQIDGLVMLYLQDAEIPLNQLGETLIQRYTK